MAEDIPGDARLLTYAELGELLGIEPESAKRRAVRAGWRRVPGNEGRTLVAVPRTAIPEHPSVPRTTAELGEKLGETSPKVGAAGRAGDMLGDIAQIPRDAPVRPGGMEHTLSRALDDLREALRNAEQRLVEAAGRAGRAEARADAAQGLADRRGEELAEVRERLGRAEGESETLREQLKAERNRSVTQIREVEAARDSAKAELAEWTAGGPLARAVRALVFRRGRS